MAAQGDEGYEEEELTMDDFVIHEQLGTGCRAIVYHCEHKASGGHYAMKVTKKADLSARAKLSIVLEVEIMHTCDHPGIVGLAAAFETKKDIMLVMELMVGGDLFDLLIKKKRFSENEARVINEKVVTALEYLHSHGIVHRDLKPENILLAAPDDVSSVKIADFGFAKYLRPDGTLITPCGTPGFVAPEIANAEAYQSSVDMWSWGVVLYTLLAGFPPFWAEDDSDLLDLIAEGRYSFPDPYWSNISDAAKDLVSRLLEKDPAKRITAEQVLAHPWARGKDTVADPRVARSQSTSAVSRHGSDDKGRLLELINRTVAVRAHPDVGSSRTVTDSDLWKARMANTSAGADAAEAKTSLASSDPVDSPHLKTRKSEKFSSKESLARRPTSEQTPPGE